MSDTVTHVTAVILAGGLARRMGGTPKGLLTLDGRTLVAQVADRLAPQSQTVLINANSDQDEYRATGLPVIADALEGRLGPLAGLLAGLESTRTPLVCSVPCDTPFLPPDLIGRLVSALHHREAPACSVWDGQRRHHAIILARRELAGPLRAYLEAGERRVHRWLERIGAADADFSDCPEAFYNINTPAQLRAAQQRLDHHDH